jgi:hypothetical protein
LTVFRTTNIVPDVLRYPVVCCFSFAINLVNSNPYDSNHPDSKPIAGSQAEVLQKRANLSLSFRLFFLLREIYTFVIAVLVLVPKGNGF